LGFGFRVWGRCFSVSAFTCEHDVHDDSEGPEVDLAVVAGLLHTLHKHLVYGLAFRVERFGLRV
jgi:hypothetical protein